MRLWPRSFDPLSLHSFVSSLLRAMIPLCLRSFFTSFFRFSFLRSFVLSFLFSFLPSFLRSFVLSLLNSVVPSSLCPFVPSFLPSFVPSLNLSYHARIYFLCTVNIFFFSSHSDTKVSFLHMILWKLNVRSCNISKKSGCFLLSLCSFADGSSLKNWTNLT